MCNPVKWVGVSLDLAWACLSNTFIYINININLFIKVGAGLVLEEWQNWKKVEKAWARPEEKWRSDKGKTRTLRALPWAL